MIVRNNEIDVATGDMRMVIIVHENKGPKFLWPALRQHPSDNNAEGLLGEWKAVCVCVFAALVFNVAYSLFPAVEAAVYEEVQQAPVRKLKIKNQEADVTGYIFFSFLYLCFCFTLFSHYYKDILSIYSFFCREMVVDYSFASPVTMNCWLMSADSALQRPLSQFVITQL